MLLSVQPELYLSVKILMILPAGAGELGNQNPQGIRQAGPGCQGEVLGHPVQLRQVRLQHKPVLSTLGPTAVGWIAKA